jgi:hypothetical protein
MLLVRISVISLKKTTPKWVLSGKYNPIKSNLTPRAAIRIYVELIIEKWKGLMGKIQSKVSTFDRKR